MNIRMADHSDIDRLIKLRFDYFDMEKHEITDDKKEMIRSQLERYFPKHLNKDFFAAFAEDEKGNIVSAGFLVIHEKPANLSWPTGKTGLILNVLTYPEYRRMGYAASVMNFLIEEAKKHELSYIELSASSMGKPLYKKLGFNKRGQSKFTDMRMYLV